MQINLSLAKQKVCRGTTSTSHKPPVKTIFIIGGESVLIGSIIDVFLAGYRILTGRFYQNFSKIDQKVILPV